MSLLHSNTEGDWYRAPFTYLLLAFSVSQKWGKVARGVARNDRHPVLFVSCVWQWRNGMGSKVRFCYYSLLYITQFCKHKRCLNHLTPKASLLSLQNIPTMDIGGGAQESGEENMWYLLQLMLTEQSVTLWHLPTTAASTPEPAQPFWNHGRTERNTRLLLGRASMWNSERMKQLLDGTQNSCSNCLNFKP